MSSQLNILLVFLIRKVEYLIFKYLIFLIRKVDQAAVVEKEDPK